MFFLMQFWNQTIIFLKDGVGLTRYMASMLNCTNVDFSFGVLGKLITGPPFCIFNVFKTFPCFKYYYTYVSNDIYE